MIVKVIQMKGFRADHCLGFPRPNFLEYECYANFGASSHSATTKSFQSGRIRMPKNSRSSATRAGGGVRVSDMKMSPEQEAHLARVKEQFLTAADIKYRRGQKEHGGNLHHVGVTSLLNCAIEEAIDQVVYLITLREVLQS